MELLLCNLHLTTSSCRHGTRDNDERLYRSYNIDRDNTPYYRETSTIYFIHLSFYTRCPAVKPRPCNVRFYGDEKRVKTRKVENIV